MAYRCIACPYTWNVPKNYDDLPQSEKDLYFHAWTIDGNFKADHTTSPQENPTGIDTPHFVNNVADQKVDGSRSGAKSALDQAVYGQEKGK